jgi:hypothetical protein
MGETDHDSIVWDHVAVYEPGRRWDAAPPLAAYSGGSVVKVVDETKTAIRQQLAPEKNQRWRSTIRPALDFIHLSRPTTDQ